MRTEYFSKGDKVLLLGEGNFSFAVSLFKKNLNIDITATCYESSVVFDEGLKNINYLKSIGVRTMLGIDATKLEDHFDAESVNFDGVIFNFPHAGGKMRIERNRKLLKEFFMSVHKFTDKSSTVFVTLCDGQGGTDFDSRKRRRDDSWQIDEMAASGNFLMTVVEPFVFHNFQDYYCVGYRSLDKPFLNYGALVHVFKKADTTIEDYVNIDLDNFNNDRLLKYREEMNLERSFEWEETIDIIRSYDSLKENISSSSSYSRLNYDKKIVALFPRKFNLHVTFEVDKNFNEFYFYAEIYLLACDVVESVKYLYEWSLKNSDKTNRTYEIIYRSYNIPLCRKRAIDIHNNFIIKIIEDRLNLMVKK